MPTVSDGLRNPLMRGKNLAVVMRYARRSPVTRVRLDHAVNAGQVGRYAVTFYFEDGAECLTYWADWRVLMGWLIARRSWGVDRVWVAHAGLMEEVTGSEVVASLRKRGTNVVGVRQPSFA